MTNTKLPQPIIWEFVTNATGSMSVRAGNERAKTFKPNEITQVENKLRTEYERLARGNQTQLEIAGIIYEVKTKPTANTRQPSLILTSTAVEFDTRPSTILPVAPTNWMEGLFAELTLLLQQSDFLQSYERFLLKGVLEDFQRGSYKPNELAAGLFTGFLALAQAHSRESDPQRSTAYQIAYSAMDRLAQRCVCDSTAIPPVGLNGTLTTENNPTRSWFGRLFGWMAG